MSQMEIPSVNHIKLLAQRTKAELDILRQTPSLFGVDINNEGFLTVTVKDGDEAPSFTIYDGYLLYTFGEDDQTINLGKVAGVQIDDTTTSTESVWSSSKVSQMIADLQAQIDELKNT